MPPKLRCRDLAIMDRIYDHILLPPLVARVLDTPEMQRLRSLHQLGSSSFVFPTATHTRFEHSVGVSYMAGKMLSHLRQQQPELELTDRDVQSCMLAGLLHDVGHGPFSHLFEDVIAKRCNIAGGFCHESMSDRLARRALQDLVPNDQLQLVLGLMHGRAPATVSYRDLVANPSGGVDVDRVDYLTRDCVMCFGRQAVDTRVNRLLQTCRLCLEHNETNAEGCWRLGFETKMAQSLQELFALRAKLHRAVYQHPVTKAIGHMIGDIFKLAAPHYKVDGQHTLPECLESEDLFLLLGDWILPSIGAQRTAELRPAQDILARLRTRDIYHKSFSRTLNILYEVERKDVDWNQALLDALPSGSGITTEDFIVEVVHVHYGKGKRNPVEDILFFNPKKPELKPMRLRSPGGALSQGLAAGPVLPTLMFEEQTLFVFEKRDTRGVLAQACDKMASNPQLAHLFVQHEIPFQN
eukprot:gene1134-665_t